MRTSQMVSGAVTLPLPGANHNIQYATNLLYQQPLGILNLKKTPVFEHKTYWWPNNGSTLLTHSYRVKNNLEFTLNPASDLEIVSKEAALVFEITANDWPRRFLEYADQGYSLIDNSPIELESFNNEKYVFRTPYIDADVFKYQKITLPSGFKLYVKLKVELKVKNSTVTLQKEMEFRNFV
ncbi:MAG: hypothetical protein M5U17_04600 [Ignavibacterium sp.]|nr:hypothetical protein [Ignavibacterium sp.]